MSLVAARSPHQHHNRFQLQPGCVLVLTDAFFLNVNSIPFTGESPREQPNLALTVLEYVLSRGGGSATPHRTVDPTANESFSDRRSRLWRLALATKTKSPGRPTSTATNSLLKRTKDFR